MRNYMFPLALKYYASEASSCGMAREVTHLRQSEEKHGLRPSDWRLFSENRGELDRQYWLID